MIGRTTEEVLGTEAARLADPYVAQALAGQSKDGEVRARFAKAAQSLSDNEDTIVAELNAAQGKPVDIGGYYRPDREKATQAMRPSTTFNAIVDAM